MGSKENIRFLDDYQGGDKERLPVPVDDI